MVFHKQENGVCNTLRVTFLFLLSVFFFTQSAYSSGGSSTPSQHHVKGIQTQTVLDLVVTKRVTYKCTENAPSPLYSSFVLEGESGNPPILTENNREDLGIYTYDYNAGTYCDYAIADREDADPDIIKSRHWYEDQQVLELWLNKFAYKLIADGHKRYSSGTENNIMWFNPFNSLEGCWGQAVLAMNEICTVNPPTLQENYKYAIVLKNPFVTTTVPGYPEANGPFAHNFLVVYTSETWGPIYIIDSWMGYEGTFKSLGAKDKALFRTVFADYL